MSDTNGDQMPSSRRLAQTWPFPRYYAYQRKMRETAKQWFDSKDLPRDPKYAFILDKWENWPSNLILPDVVEYIKRHKVICEGEGNRGIPVPAWARIPCCRQQASSLALSQFG